MRKLTVIMGVLALAFGAFAGEPSSAAAAPQGTAEARKTLADFFLRTHGVEVARGARRAGLRTVRPALRDDRLECRDQGQGGWLAPAGGRRGPRPRRSH